MRLTVRRSFPAFFSFASSISSSAATYPPSFGFGRTPRLYRCSVSSERGTFRTVFRDMFIVLAIDLIDFPPTRLARRTFPIVSTVNISDAPIQQCGTPR